MGQPPPLLRSRRFHAPAPTAAARAGRVGWGSRLGERRGVRWRRARGFPMPGCGARPAASACRPSSPRLRRSVRLEIGGAAGHREPPARQEQRPQHPPRRAPALAVAAAGRHECYYSARRCRSIALSQWQGATGLILRAVRGVHLSPATSPSPPPPPGPTAAPAWPRVGARRDRQGPGGDGRLQVRDSSEHNSSFRKMHVLRSHLTSRILLTQVQLCEC
ncbi:uncharacterized protein LOC143272596 [Peromyscus maniculatus bairdii]|uniref:uncharacterized protein LOC143272596 n=1 Tax=Peromyscus maniculatus bairdii TaxID=230844 RepID=UPI003FD4186C